MSNFLLDALGLAGNVLDTPGSVARGLLAGEADRALGGVFDPSRRVSGRDMLESWGALGENQEGLDFGDVAGLGAEVALDPANLIGGLFLGRAAKAAKQANALRANPTLAAASRYADEVIPELAKSGFRAEKRMIPKSGRTTVAMDLFKDDLPIGKAMRDFSDDGTMHLSWVGTEGKTGLMKPLYGAESDFARRNALDVESRLASPVTRAKFSEHYPGAVAGKKDNYRWAGGGGPLGERFAPPEPRSLSPILALLGGHNVLARTPWRDEND